MAQKKKKEREKKDAHEARIKILKEKIKAQQKEEWYFLLIRHFDTISKPFIRILKSLNVLCLL